MEIIPVIDLMGGVVVHARQGQRDYYRPIHTPLCRSSNPNDVIDAFLSLHPFRTFYAADLDALMGKNHQAPLIEKLAAAYPQLQFWIDGGWPAVSGSWTPVVGTESLDPETWLHLRSTPSTWILSLDFFAGRYTGPTEVLQDTASWPERIIVMSLNRVGSDLGPDWKQLAQIRKAAPEKRVIAAGGIRSTADLNRLEEMGIDQALLASALHDGRIDLAKG